MSIYAVIRKSDQVEVYRYSADAPIEWDGWPWDQYDNVEIALPPPPPPPPPEPVKITKLAFRNRFTPTEKAYIEFAAADNPSATTQARMQSAALRANLDDQRDATYIDLTRSDTRAGVQMLEQIGLLAAGRATVILDTPPTDEELYRG